MSGDAVFACEFTQQIAMLGVERAALSDAFARGSPTEIVGERRQKLRLIAVGPNDRFSWLDGRENTLDRVGAYAAVERSALEACEALREIGLRESRRCCCQQHEHSNEPTCLGGRLHELSEPEAYQRSKPQRTLLERGYCRKILRIRVDRDAVHSSYS